MATMILIMVLVALAASYGIMAIRPNAPKLQSRRRRAF